MATIMIGAGVHLGGEETPTTRCRWAARIFGRFFSNRFPQARLHIWLNNAETDDAKDHAEEEDTDRYANQNRKTEITRIDCRYSSGNEQRETTENE